MLKSENVSRSTQSEMTRTSALDPGKGRIDEFRECIQTLGWEQVQVRVVEFRNLSFLIFRLYASQFHSSSTISSAGRRRKIPPIVHINMTEKTIEESQGWRRTSVKQSG